MGHLELLMNWRQAGMSSTHGRLVLYVDLLSNARRYPRPWMYGVPRSCSQCWQCLIQNIVKLTYAGNHFMGYKQNKGTR
jgi:hypothetical protein